MSGMAARCLVSRLSECLLVISEHAAGLLLVKGTPSIAEVQRTSGNSESSPMTLRSYYRYRPKPEVQHLMLQGLESRGKETFVPKYQISTACQAVDLRYGA